MQGDDRDLDSISIVDSSGSKHRRNHRQKAVAARSEADQLRLEAARKDSEILELSCRVRLLEHQLLEARGGVSTLISHLPRHEVGFAFPPQWTAPPLAGAPPFGFAPGPPSYPPAPAPPPAPASPPQAFIVPAHPDPPILPDPGSRLVVTDPSVPQYAAPAPRPRSISDRLGDRAEFYPRRGEFRGRPRRGSISSPQERRSRSRGSPPPPPGSSEPPALHFTQGSAGRRPPYHR